MANYSRNLTDGNLSALLVRPQDYETQIKMGMIDGMSWVHKFGDNDDVDSAREDIWGHGINAYAGAFPFPASAETLYVSSSSSADQNITVGLEALDTNWAILTKTAITDGSDGQTGVVFSGGASLRNRRAYNNSGTDAVGTIYIGTESSPTAGVPAAANIRAVIRIGESQTQIAADSIEAGYMGFLVRACGAAETTAKFSVRIRELGGVFRVRGGSIIGSGAPAEPMGIMLGEKTDIVMSAASPGQNDSVTAWFDWIKIDATKWTLPPN